MVRRNTYRNEFRRRFSPPKIEMVIAISSLISWIPVSVLIDKIGSPALQATLFSIIVIYISLGFLYFFVIRIFSSIIVFNWDFLHLGSGRECAMTNDPAFISLLRKVSWLAPADRNCLDDKEKGLNMLIRIYSLVIIVCLICAPALLFYISDDAPSTGFVAKLISFYFAVLVVLVASIWMKKRK